MMRCDQQRANASMRVNWIRFQMNGSLLHCSRYVDFHSLLQLFHLAFNIFDARL